MTKIKILGGDFKKASGCSFERGNLSATPNGAFLPLSYSPGRDTVLLEIVEGSAHSADSVAFKATFIDGKKLIAQTTADTYNEILTVRLETDELPSAQDIDPSRKPSGVLGSYDERVDRLVKELELEEERKFETNPATGLPYPPEELEEKKLAREAEKKAREEKVRVETEAAGGAENYAKIQAKKMERVKGQFVWYITGFLVMIVLGVSWLLLPGDSDTQKTKFSRTSPTSNTKTDWVLSSGKGKVIVWKSGAAHDEGLSLLGTDAYKSNPQFVYRLMSCIVSDGTKAIVTSVGILTHDILVISGPKAGCRGNIPSEHLGR